MVRTLVFPLQGAQVRPLVWEDPTNHMVWPKKEKRDGERLHIHRGEDHVKTEAEARAMQPQVRDAWSHQKPEEKRDQFSSRALPACAALLTPRLCP